MEINEAVRQVSEMATAHCLPEHELPWTWIVRRNKWSWDICVVLKVTDRALYSIPGWAPTRGRAEKLAQKIMRRERMAGG